MHISEYESLQICHVEIWYINCIYYVIPLLNNCVALALKEVLYYLLEMKLAQVSLYLVNQCQAQSCKTGGLRLKWVGLHVLAWSPERGLSLGFSNRLSLKCGTHHLSCFLECPTTLPKVGCLPNLIRASQRWCFFSHDFSLIFIFSVPNI